MTDVSKVVGPIIVSGTVPGLVASSSRSAGADVCRLALARRFDLIFIPFTIWILERGQAR